MDPKEDKNLWEKQYLEGVGHVLLVEEGYYDALAEEMQRANNQEESGIEKAWEQLGKLLKENRDQMVKSGIEEVIQRKQDPAKIATFNGAHQAYEMVIEEMEQIKAHFTKEGKEEE